MIIDSPCFYKEGLDTGLAIANQNSVDYRYIECIVDDYSIIENRLSNRARLATQIEGTTREVYLKCYDQSVKPVNIKHLTVDTSNVNNIDFEMVKAYLIDNQLKRGSYAWNNNAFSNSR